VDEQAQLVHSIVHLKSGTAFYDKSCTSPTQRAHKRLVNVSKTFKIAFRIGSEYPFIERLGFT